MHKVLYLKQVTNKGLLYSIWKSAQYYVAAWMGGKFGGEWIHLYAWLHPFTVHMKLSQHCWLAISQYNIKSSKKEKELSVKKLLQGGTWGETTGGSHTTHRNFHLSSGKLREGQKRRLNKPCLPLILWEKGLCVDFTALWVRPGITHHNASHQSCRT